jgi:transposase
LKLDTPQQILALSRAETNAPKRLRLLAISHFLETGNRAEISRILKVSRCSVNKWVASYLSNGLPALEAKKTKGRPCPLSIEQQEQLSNDTDKQSRSIKGGRLTGEAIRIYIAEQFQINYHPNAIYK